VYTLLEIEPIQAGIRPALKRDDPKLFRVNMTYIKDCMTGLCLTCAVEAAAFYASITNLPKRHPTQALRPE